MPGWISSAPAVVSRTLDGMSRTHVEHLSNLMVVAMFALILVAVLLPASSLGGQESRLRSLSEQESWVVHAALFTGLGGTIGFRLVTAGRTGVAASWVLAAVVLIATFATLTEMAQLGVDGRNAALGDWIADLLGMTAGLSFALAVGPLAIEWATARRTR
jgi:VanZ family protein